MEKGNKKFPSFPAIVQCFAYKIKSESFSVYVWIEKYKKDWE